MQVRLDSSEAFRVAIVGDIHGAWHEADVAYFNDSHYDLILFVGDLGSGTLRSDLGVARSIARLAVPSLVMPGNNDTVHFAQLAAELIHQQGLIKLLSLGHQRRSRALAKALGQVEMCGFSLHEIRPERGDIAPFDIIAARPHAMGGSSFSFAPLMERAHGIRSLDESTARLRALVDQSDQTDVVFLAHNGPTGLGDAPHDIFGCDFKTDGGDWGDDDLAHAVDYAKQAGKRVRAVIAGHMHHRVRGGGKRPWRIEKEGIEYLNTARVPRIFPGPDSMLYHHVALTFQGDELSIEEILIPGR